MKTQESGFSLIEVLVSLGIIAIITGVLAYLQSESVNSLSQLTKFSSTSDVIYEIQQSIQKENPYLVAYPAGTTLDDPRVSVVCFTKMGGTLPRDPSQPPPSLSDEGCVYEVSYIKVEIDDRSFPQSSHLGKIPLSKIYYRVRYYSGDRAELTQDPSQREGSIESLEFAQIMANYVID